MHQEALKHAQMQEELVIEKDSHNDNNSFIFKLFL